MGSSATVKTIRSGVVWKRPWDFKSELFISDARRQFKIEPLILQHLGNHPRIVKYLGPADDGNGILVDEARYGDLRDYVDSNYPQIGTELRAAFCRQAVEAVVYIHARGVLHSDLRPGNFLVHKAPGSDALELVLCDFGGSMCAELGLDGLALPSVPFIHPAFGVESSVGLDIFGLGSIFYFVLTGLWPYRDVRGRPRESEERRAYEAVADKFLGRDEFPDVSGLAGAGVIMKCWKRQYKSAQDVLDDLVAVGF